MLIWGAHFQTLPTVQKQLHIIMNKLKFSVSVQIPWTSATFTMCIWPRCVRGWRDRVWVNHHPITALIIWLQYYPPTSCTSMHIWITQPVNRKMHVLSQITSGNKKKNQKMKQCFIVGGRIKSAPVNRNTSNRRKNTLLMIR